MRKMGIGLLALLFVGLGLAVAEDVPAAPNKAGYALIDMYIRGFQAMATQGTTAEGLESNLRAVATAAFDAKEAATIDQVFFSRFARILALTKLVIAPDPGNLLRPVIDREIADLIMDVTGEAVPAGAGPVAVGRVANAIAEELVNLQLYLDTLEKRQAIRKKLDESMSGSPDKK